MTRPSEDALIDRWLRPLATDPAALNLRDDCARLLPPAGHDLILKTDSIAEGVHFFPQDPWDAVAQKALRVNLSDLAAKGARPLGYLLSLALPADWTEHQMDALAEGLAADQALYGVPLLGGDTIRSPKGLILSVTILGAVPAGQGPARMRAQTGDRIYLTGTLGDAALGLRLRLDERLAASWRLDSHNRDFLLGRYLLPQPRLELAGALLAHAHGAMDVSDGLLIDLGRMCRASGLSAELDTEAVPLSAAARAALDSDSELQKTILTGGDDYEILATVPDHAAAAFEAAAAAGGVAVAAIGRIIPASGEAQIRESRGRPLLSGADGGFSHF